MSDSLMFIEELADSTREEWIDATSLLPVCKWFWRRKISFFIFLFSWSNFSNSFWVTAASSFLSFVCSFLNCWSNSSSVIPFFLALSNPFKYSIYCLSFETEFGLDSLKSIGLIFMVTWLALYANLSVFMVSSMFFEEGEIFPIMKVFVLIVKDSWSSRVSLDSLNAATLVFLPLERA